MHFICHNIRIMANMGNRKKTLCETGIIIIIITIEVKSIYKTMSKGDDFSKKICLSK